MATRPRKNSRWPTVLAELLALPMIMAGLWFATPTHAHGGSSGGTSDSAPLEPALLDGSSDLGQRVGGEDVYLDVTLNGASSGLAHFALRQGELWASAATLRQLGFVLPASTPDPVRLNSLEGIQASYDAARQAVDIVAPLRLLHLATSVLNAPSASVPEATASPGLLLNYDLYGTQRSNGDSNLSAFTELRAFSDWGVLTSTSLAQTARTAGNWSTHSARLDTTWSTSFPDRMLTLRIGDTLTGYLSWSRPTRIAGVQLSRNFALQPYRITAPLPSFLGSATLPSQVELYVNGLRQYSGKVPAGPFQLNAIPNISGSGNAQVVLTDALGRSTTVNFSLYAARQLLQKGLSDWSTEVGVVRRNYGLSSFDYGHDPAGSGTWRYGVSDNLTASAHAELTRGLANGGAGGAWLLGTAGVLSGSVAVSRGSGADGTQLNLGYEWRNDRFNFAIDGTRTRGAYRDIASLNGAPAPTISARALAGYTLDRLGSFGISYLHLRFAGQHASRYATAYWFKALGQAGAINVNLSQNLDNRTDRSIGIGYTLAFDDHSTVSAGVQRSNGNTRLTLDAGRTPPTAGGFGWRAQAQVGGGLNGGTAELDYLGRYGRVAGGFSAVGGNRYAFGQADGAVVLMAGQPFAARRIDDAFALVSTDGVANVPVTLENRPIGNTDRHGLLLVTPLNAYQSNQLAIDPMDLPANVRIDRVKSTATPSDRAGTLVTFGIHPIRAATVVLLDAAGKPLPLGSQVYLLGRSGPAAGMVGYDGEAYLDTLEAHNRLRVDTPTCSCQVNFDYPRTANGIPQIGPLHCTEGLRP